MATSLLLLAPLSAGLGLALIFQAGVLVGSGMTNVSTLVETGAGVFLFALAFPSFFSSLGVFASRNNLEAERWIRWLGKLRPNIMSYEQILADTGKYRIYAMAILLVVFTQAILLIPGIGEDRKYPLDQFYGFFGSLWYFYVLATGVGGFILIYYRRPGGSIPAIVMSVLSIGTSVADVLGLLPPSAPTLRTTVLMLSVLPLAVLLILVSWRALRLQPSQ